MTFYQQWAEETAALLVFRDQYSPEQFDTIAHSLVEKWEHYPPHAEVIKQMGEEWARGEI